MGTLRTDAEAWREAVSRTWTPAAWLVQDAPESDVVLSSRVRYARNLTGFRFPHHSAPDGLRAVQRQVRRAVERAELPLTELERVNAPERDFLRGCRLIAPEFTLGQGARSLWLDPRRRLSLMVNEEDHIRLQALTGGFSLGSAQRLADDVLERLEDHLEFAHHSEFGWLTASPSNVGPARRWSIFFNLAALEHTGRLPGIIDALENTDMVVRGLFGELSRRVGAFLQVSAIEGPAYDFNGAAKFLLQAEREARRDMPRFKLEQLAKEQRDGLLTAPEISLAQSLAALSWIRWAGAAGIAGFPAHYRVVDQWMTHLDVAGTTDARVADRHRAEYLRHQWAAAETEGRA